MGTNKSGIRTVFSEEFRRATRRTWFRVMTLAVPALLLVMVIAVPVVRGLLSATRTARPRPCE
jgi:peptidoglycan biosynthesis protein MviN/MurJ (putative lipid II flippase)